MSNFKESLINQSQEVLTISLDMASIEHYFEGHFESFKILPALVQIGFIVELIKKYFEVEIRVKGAKQLKFMKPIFPDDIIEVIIKSENDKFSFQMNSCRGMHTKGNILR